MGVITFPQQKLKYHPDFVDYLLSINDGSDGSYSPGSGSLAWGVYRHTTININSGVTLAASGSPLILLATQSITVEGVLSADGQGGHGGAASAGNSLAGGNGAGRCGAGGGGGGGGFSGSGGSGTTQNAGNTDFTGGSSPYRSATTMPSVGTNGGTSGGDKFAVPFITSSLRDLSSWKGGGGASGSTGSSVLSGAGGNGGGLIILIAPRIKITGTVSANGLGGGAGQSSSTYSAGSGGGGGGGGIVMFASSYLLTGSITANGGLGGPQVSGGTYQGAAGGKGGDGFVLRGIL